MSYYFLTCRLIHPGLPACRLTFLHVFLLTLGSRHVVVSEAEVVSDGVGEVARREWGEIGLELGWGGLGT